MYASSSFPRALRPVATLALAVAVVLPSPARADNPIVQTFYTADPAPMVYGDRLYVYTTHDEDVTVNNFFTMNDWRVYSTADMVNWTDHGSPLSYKSFTWGTGDAWAGQCVERNGKFYFYVPLNNSTGTKIGVAVADTPTGPFKDAIGKPLLSGGGYIDPTAYVDSDGQAYLYWGNPKLYYVKLNENMTSYSGSVTQVNLTAASFGTRTSPTADRPAAYEEGPWFYKRDALYYMIYPADSTPEKISYSTGTGPTGPWTFRGDIQPKQSGAGSSFTNHPGIADFKGKSYFFYHNGALPGGGGYKRSVCVEEFTYGADGSIPAIKMTTAGPAPVANLNPFERTEAETIAFSAGLKTEACSDTGGGQNVTSINNGDYIKVRAVDFRTGATSLELRVAAAGSGGNIELRVDSATGTVLATCAIAGTGGAQTWATQTCTVSGLTGLHDLFMKFTGGSGDLFKFNWWRFIPRDPLADAGAGDALAGDAGADTRGGTGGTTGSGGSTGAGGAGGATATGGGSGTARGGAGGGDASAGGTSGNGGARATGGTSGSTSSAGAGGSGGSSASGGASSGGVSGAAGSGGSGSGGAVTSGGRSGSGGSATGGASSDPNSSSDAGGCACQQGPGRGSGYVALGLLLLAALLRRRTAS